MPTVPTEPDDVDLESSSRREVVITGVGVVSPIGIGRDEYWSSLMGGRSGVREIRRFDTSTSRCRFGAEVLDFDAKKYVRPRKSLKVMSLDIQLGFSAAELAITDSGLQSDDADPERMAVMFASDLIFAQLGGLEDTYRNCMVDGRFDFDRWGQSAMANMHPLWMLKHLPNMPACHIAIAHDARGPNNSITVGEASSLLAIAEAMRIIERGQADVVIGGGTGCQLNPTVYDFRGRGRFTQWQGDPAAACRPFDAARDGTVQGEGAAAFVLESREHAERRNANILGRVLGYASGFEPMHNGAVIKGTAIRAGITAALKSANLQPEDIDHVNAHGIATVDDDRAEAQAIHDILGDVPVMALKSYFGNLGAGSGAVEMAASVLALNEGVLPASLNYDQPDATCPVNVIHGAARAVEKQAALLLNQGRAGQAAAVVFAKE